MPELLGKQRLTGYILPDNTCPVSFSQAIWHNFVNYAKESDVEKRAILLSYVLTTLKTDRNSSLSDRPALPLVA